MDPLEKAILSSLYLSNLVSEDSPYERIRSRLLLPEAVYEAKLYELSQRGFIDKSDQSKITFIGRDAIKVILVGGVFDLIHPGHIHTLKAAKTLGDVLVVVIARTSTAIKINKERRIYHDEFLRQELVSSLHFVDLAIIGREGTIYDTVEFVRPDVIALGYDQSHTEKEISENCIKRNLNIRTVRLNTSIPLSKSSKIKDELGGLFYNT